MVKRMLCLVIGIMFLFGGNGDCGVLTGGSYAPTSSYDDIVFYFNCDSATTGQSPQKTPGTETMTIGANVTTTTGVVGNGLVLVGDAEADRVALSAVSGITDISSGQMIIAVKEVTANYLSTYIVNMAYRIYLSINSNYSLFFHIETGNVEVGGSSTTFQYYTLKWDDATSYFACRINDGSWVESTGDANYQDQADVTYTTFCGNSNNQVIDQIIISNDTERDMYAIRDVTDFS